jgi:hypothetical protein
LLSFETDCPINRVFLRQVLFGFAALRGQAKTPSLAHALEHSSQGVPLLILLRSSSLEIRLAMVFTACDSLAVRCTLQLRHPRADALNLDSPWPRD